MWILELVSSRSNALITLVQMDCHLVSPVHVNFPRSSSYALARLQLPVSNDSFSVKSLNLQLPIAGG